MTIGEETPDSGRCAAFAAICPLSRMTTRSQERGCDVDVVQHDDDGGEREPDCVVTSMKSTNSESDATKRISLRGVGPLPAMAL